MTARRSRVARLLAIAWMAAACGDDGAAGAGGAGGGGTSSSSTGALPSLCDEPDEPPQAGTRVPDGWTSWSCIEPHAPCTVLWLPPDASDVEPIAWVPCTDGLLEGTPCEQTPYGAGVAFFTTDDEFRPLLGIERNDVYSREFVLAEPDGPVRLAALQTDAVDCELALRAASSDRLALELAHGEGLVLLEASGPRLVQRDFPTGSSREWRLSDAFLLRAAIGSVDRFDVDVDLERRERVSQPGADFRHLVTVGDDLVFGSFTEEQGYAIHSFSGGVGVRFLEAFPGDPDQGAFDLGADGTWMVWMRGSGRDSNNGLFASTFAMASPFTTDPAAVEPRQVGSWGTQFPGSPWVVGCGHAARQGVGQLQLMRLADGASWDVAGRYSIFAETMGISCKHIYLRNLPGVGDGIFRIALSSLGA